MRLSIFLSLISVWILSSCNTEEPVEPLFCEAEKELLGWSDFEEDSIVDLDFSLTVEELEISVVKQYVIPSSSGQHYIKRSSPDKIM